jgi:hypothetical protein
MSWCCSTSHVQDDPDPQTVDTVTGRSLDRDCDDAFPRLEETVLMTKDNGKMQKETMLAALEVASAQVLDDDDLARSTVRRVSD